MGPVWNSRTLNLGTFQLKPLQGVHFSKVDKNFCLVSDHFRETPLCHHLQKVEKDQKIFLTFWEKNQKENWNWIRWTPRLNYYFEIGFIPHFKRNMEENICKAAKNSYDNVKILYYKNYI